MIKLFLRLKAMGILLLLFPLLMTTPCHATDIQKSISEKIQELKDPARSDQDKGGLSREIQASGMKAIPLLVDCVKDSAPIGKVPATGGECINAPANAPVPPRCQNPQWTETLGERCESLLYNIITPAYTSPHMVQLTSKQAPPRPFIIPDWKKWWEKYQAESLEQIQLEARKKIDAFWLQGYKNSIVWN